MQVSTHGTASRPTARVLGLGAGALLACCALAAGEAQALTDIQCGPMDATVAATTWHVVTLTSEAVVPDGGSLRLTYPASFGFSAVTLGSTSGFGAAGLTISVVDSTIAVTVSGASVPAGPLHLELGGVVNAPRAAAYTVAVETRAPADVLLEGPTLSAPFTLLAGPPTSLTLEPPGPQMLAAGGSLTVAARATDAHGNAVAGVDVTLFAKDVLDGALSSTGETDSLGVAQQRGSTQSDGRVHVQYRAPFVAGRSDLLDAAAPGMPASAVADLACSSVAAPAAAVRLIPPAGPVRAGEELGLLRVQLVDPFGNVDTTANATIRVTAPVGSGITFALGVGGPFSAPFDLPVSGEGQLWWRGGPAGTYPLAGADQGGGLTSDSQPVTVIAGIQVASLALGAPDSVVAGQPFATTVLGFDAFGNFAQEAVLPFTFDAVLASDTTVVSPQPLAVAAGALQAGSFSTNAQSATHALGIRLRANAAGHGWLAGVTHVLPGPAYELVGVTPDTLRGIVAGSAVDAVVEVRDAWGNPVAGVAVATSAVDGGTLEAAPGITDASGRASARLRTNAIVGVAHIRLRILDGAPTSRETYALTVLTRSGPLAALRVSSASSAVVAGSTLDLLVEALDAAGNPVDDAADSLRLAATAPGATLVPPRSAFTAGRLLATLVDTTAGPQRVVAATIAAPALADTSAIVNVVHAVPVRVEAVNDTTQSAMVNASVVLRARVSDRYGNAVSGEPVRVEWLSGPAGATLADNDPPADDGLARTDGAGEATATLTLGPLTGEHLVRASILDRTPPDLESLRWRVAALPSAAATLALEVAGGPLVAGAARPLTVSVRDAAGNLVPVTGSVTLAVVPASGTITPNPVPLLDGAGSAALRGTTAGPLSLSATLDGAPSVAGMLGPLSVVPNVPAGLIAVPLVEPPVNTANGLAVTRLVAGPVTDTFGNVVTAATPVTVDASLGVLLSEDADSGQAGVQRVTDAAGMLEARLVAPTTPGSALVTFTAGGAAGSAVAAFEERAAITYAGGLAPTVAAPGQFLAFTVDVRNDGQADADLAANATALELDDGAGHSFVAPLSAQRAVPGGGSVQLSFDPTALDPAFRPGPRRPVLRFGGLDSHGQSVMGLALLPDGALSVTGLALLSLTVAPLEAALGDTVVVTALVQNNGGAPAQLTTLTARTVPPADLVVVAQDPPVQLAAGAQGQFHLWLRLGPGTPIGDAIVLAAATAQSGGIDDVSAEVAAPVPLHVITRARLAAVPASVLPDRASKGTTIALLAAVRNDGSASPVLDPARTLARLRAGATVVATAPLAQAQALAGASVHTLAFAPAVIAPAAATGLYDLEVELIGSELGRAFSDTLTWPAAVRVEGPAAITLALPAVSPDRVSVGASVRFTVHVVNSGEAAIELDRVATVLHLGEPAADRIQTQLDVNGPAALPPGTTALDFAAVTLPGDLVLAVPPARLELRGRENGHLWTATFPLPAGSIVAQQPAALQIVATAPSQATVTAQQQRPWSVAVVVRNNGQAALGVDPTQTRLDLVADAGAAGGFVLALRGALAGGGWTLVAGETDTLTWDVTGTTTTAGPVVLLPHVEALDLNSLARLQDGSQDGGFGLVHVQSPAVLTGIALHVTPDTLGAGRTAPFSARARLQNTGGSDVSLVGIAPFTALTANYNGAPLPLPFTLQPPFWQGSGTLRLTANASDSLAFSVTGPLPPAGQLDLTAHVRAVEINSGRVLDESIATASPLVAAPLLALESIAGRGQGSLLPLEPGQIRVNAAGTAQLIVRLANRGGGTADDVRLRVHTDSGRIDALLGIAALSDTALLSTPIPAAAQGGIAEWLRVELTSAQDRYGALPAAIAPTARVDSLALRSLRPAVLVAEAVVPRDLALAPLTQITAGQAQAFLVDLELHNTGEGPLQLAPPRPQDLAFLIANQLQGDYVVAAPAGLLTSGGLLLDGLARDTLRYSVQRAGTLAGAAVIRLDAAGVDLVSGAALGAQGEGALSVQSQAGLRIVSTRARNPRSPSAEVNAGQTIPIRVVVVNAGQEAIDSLVVSVAGSAIPASTAAPASLARLAAGATDSLDVPVTVTPTLGTETLLAHVMRAHSANTGLPVPELAPLDNAAALLIQRPVQLRWSVTLPQSADPQRAAVSPGQLVTLRAALEGVAPLGQQGAWLPATFGFTSLAPFTLEPPATGPWTVAPGADFVELQLRAPSVPGAYTVTASLVSLPGDANDPSRAPLLGSAVGSVALDVAGGVGFDACALSIVAPLGAQDARVSTGQTFTVRAMLSAPQNLQQRTLRLLVPGALELPGGNPLRSLAAGVDTASWQLRAPTSVATQLPVRLLASAVDVQSTATITDTCATLLVDVERAAVALAAGAFSSPVSARDLGQVYPGAPFTLKGWIEHGGDASFSGGAALRLTIPPSYTFTGGAGPVAALPSSADTVSWTLLAPATPGAGVEAFQLQLQQPPLDANSETPAGDPARVVSLALATIESRVRLAAGDAAGAGPIVGEQDARDRLTLRLENQSAAVVHWTALAVSVVDEGGQPLTDPAATVAELVLRSIASSAAWSAAVSATPVAIPFPVTLSPGETAQFALAARAASGDAFTPFALRIALGSGIDALTPDGSPVVVELTDLQGAPRGSISSSISVRTPNAFASAAHSYPNPFVPSRGSAVIAYTLAQPTAVSIEIFDLLGDPVRNWSIPHGDARGAAGVHDGDVLWDGRNGRGQPVRNGLYTCRIRGAGQESFFRIAVTR